MLQQFMMNGILWKVEKVKPNSKFLIDRTGTFTVATTDPNNHTVYLSEDLQGNFKTKVLIHELGHCMMVSYGLVDDVQRMVKPEYRIYAEEFICNVFADYGMMIFETAYEILGDKAIHVVPKELDLLIA